MLSENGDVIKQTRPGARPLDLEYPKWRTDATMWISRQFRGLNYIEMRMRRVRLSMRTEGIRAFSNPALQCDGRNDTKTISVDANLFENGAKQLRFRLVFAHPQNNAGQERSHMVASVLHFGYSRSIWRTAVSIFLMTSPFSDSIVFSVHTRKQRFQKASFSNPSTLGSIFEWLRFR